MSGIVLETAFIKNNATKRKVKKKKRKQAGPVG
jgi:hypothetical protein